MLGQLLRLLLSHSLFAVEIQPEFTFHSAKYYVTTAITGLPGCATCQRSGGETMPR